MTNQTQSGSAVDLQAVQTRLQELEREVSALRQELAESNHKLTICFKALKISLPEKCSVEEAAEWFDIMEDHKAGRLIPMEQVLAEMHQILSSEANGEQQS